MVQGVEIVDGHIINVNPADGKIISKTPTTPLADLPAVVAAARASQPDWSATPLPDRIRALRRTLLANLAPRRDELARLVTLEMGKPLHESYEEVDGAIDKDAVLALMESANADRLLDDGTAIVRDPLGVAVAIGPWNFPVDELLLLALPALVAGNAVILKPSEAAPLSGAAAGEALAAGLPKGVVQVVQGGGRVGEALTACEGVDLVALTGSSATGGAVARACAEHGMKRVVLEMGGKDPMVVFADADMERAAQDAVKFSLYNAGQVCCSIERIYVEETARKDFEKRVLKIAKEYKVGDGMEFEHSERAVGPLVSSVQKKIVSGHVESALRDGATLLYRSDLPTCEGVGNFYPITVLSNLSQDAEIMRKETFGPVVAMAGFDGSNEEAVRLANDTEYGLAAYVYSSDLDRARAVARRIRAGQVGINCYSLFEADPRCPWVGHKSSGRGHHSGTDGYQMFSVPKSLVLGKQ